MKSYELPIRGNVIFALQKLAEMQRPGQSGQGGPRVTPTSIASEILEVAVIERFEKTFGMTVTKGMELAADPRGQAGRRPCVATRLPFRVRTAAAGAASQADGFAGDDGPEAA